MARSPPPLSQAKPAEDSLLASALALASIRSLAAPLASLGTCPRLPATAWARNMRDPSRSPVRHFPSPPFHLTRV